MKLRWLLPSLLGTLLLCPTAEAAKLKYWRFNSKQDRLDFITDARVRPTAKVILNPTRLVVDLPGTVFGKPKISQLIDKKIRVIRAGQFNRRTTRIVVELAPGYTLNSAGVRVRGLSSTRWFVQLPEPQRLPEKPVPKERSATIPVPPPQPVARQIPKASLVIVVDPGHGGRDVGAVGIGGLQEKRVIFPIASEVVKLLKDRGVNAVLTRSNDQFVSLASRVAQGKGFKADAFVSIHANAINLSRPDVNGLETYHAPGALSGARLARTIHNSILRNVTIRDRGVRRARFYVLRKSSMPAVLVEVGFVTGREDAAKLAQASHRSKMAQAIAEGILRYFQVK